MALQFTRNATVYVELVDASGTHVEAWKLSVLDGFSFTQSINSSEITISEAGATSRRARLLFNDSLAPVEWSMSTYARPIVSTNIVHMPEEPLWAMLLGSDSYNPATGVFFNTQIGAEDATNANINAPAATTNTFDFSASNVSSFSDRWNIYFSFEDGANIQVYKLDSAAVNSATVDFDIDGIATVQWSGFAKSLTDAGVTVPGDLAGAQAIGITETTNFIRNRISTLDLVRKDKLVGSPAVDVVTGITVNGVNADSQLVLAVTGDISQLNVGDSIAVPTSVVSSQTVASINGQNITLSANIDVATAGGEVVTVTSALYDRYELVLTGGSFSIENNVSYLTPEELGVVNAPLANITGARSISGSMTCYLDNDAAASKSGELFADLVTDTDTIRNVFDMSINIGGETASTPRIEFSLPTAHIEIPTINVEDLLTLEINFHGQVANGNVDNTDEATIIYKA